MLYEQALINLISPGSSHYRLPVAAGAYLPALVKLAGLVLWFLFLPLALAAQPDGYRFSRVNSEDSHINNQVNCILKDSRGFMWFGTNAGLHRYNGYSFRVFQHEPGDSTSISGDFILNLAEDPQGYIWVMGQQGLDIYDPATERFLRDPGPFLKRYGLPDANIVRVRKDRRGHYWFLHQSAGLYRYIPDRKKTVRVAQVPGDRQTMSSNRVADFAEDQQGDIWVMHANGVLEKLDGQTGRVTYRNQALQQQTGGKEKAYVLFPDADGDLWIFVTLDDNGVFYFSRQHKTFQAIHTGSRPWRLNNNLVRSITQDDQGLIWIGTDHGGINLINKRYATVRYLTHHPGDARTISQNSIYSLYKDDTGIIWVGTYKEGINYYHRNLYKFRTYRHDPQNPASLPYNDVNRFAEDAQGNLWIGTNGGGLLYFNRAGGTFRQYRAEPGNPAALSSNVVVGLHLDRAQQLWIGTYFGGLNQYDGQRFRHYQHDPARPASIASDLVWDVFEDSRGQLWIGTLGGGLDVFDRQQQTFQHFKAGQPNSIHTDYILHITEDRQGDLWFATGMGIGRYGRPSGRFSHYANTGDAPGGLIHNNVNTVLADERGLIWIGTNKGLALFDKQKNTFRSFRKEQGLPDNTILGILEDKAHHIWVSTQNGISQLKINTGQEGHHRVTFKNYGVSDGLQGPAFNTNAAFKTSKGELVFGGSQGFNIFDPQQFEVNRSKPRVVLTDLQIFNQPVGVGQEWHGRVLLDSALSQTREIVLQHRENMFTVSFAALSYLQPEKNQYAYLLEGFNDTWLRADSKTRRATFTNLDPGTYVFRVKAANNDGIWNEQGVRLRITILPPFWQSRPAFALYLVVLAGTLFLARRSIQVRERLNFRLEQERQEARRLHELNRMKTRFFTNVSHEFRTPLTLILTPLNRLIDSLPEGQQKSQLLLVHRNARRLLNLVNQLLDFRKMETRQIPLHLTPGEVVAFVREVAASFSDLAEQKQIAFTFHAATDRFPTRFDHDKLEKIVLNLLSNAFKFTLKGGRIVVRLEVKEKEAQHELAISVEDDGIGIPKENQEQIFESFFQHQIPGTMVNQGSGIGLALTKEFVKLMGGTITVASAPGTGSCFTVLLPLQAAADLPALPPATQEAAPAAAVENPADTPGQEDIQSPEAAGRAEDTHNPEPAGSRPAPDGRPGNQGRRPAKKPVLLLVEDNEDFRFYLQDNLKEYYQIAEAANGREGWSQVLALMPDLVVSDVAMPEMDGVALCRKIKADTRTSHIPVILLTANSSEENVLEGYKTGANDYITKPFNFEILQSRIRNLVNLQASIRQSFQQYLDVNPQQINITSLDEKFIVSAIELVEKNMDNPNFSVEDMGRQLGLSRTSLYKKILSLTGKSPLEFIRVLRLKRAAQLLVESQLSVAEIAAEVGFNTVKYFTKYFKEEFNCLPSAYARKKRSETN
jgi:signal transduction histidine kinase/ligand-binding sensor domain-containing protein/DNA-binding response OmpR family regulator